MKQRRQGFTIVEMLVVIIVIGILAGITVVAFSGVLRRSRDAARLAELTQVDKLIELYKVSNGVYPLTAADMVPNNLYCVGTGFPGGRCWPLNQQSIPGGAETDMRVTTRLRKIGQLPDGHLLVDGVGTHIWIIDSSSFELNGSFEGKTCPNNFSQTEDYGGHTQCIKVYHI